MAKSSPDTWLSARKDKDMEALKLGVAKQQERAASAEKELLEVKERTAPRRLTDKQRAVIKRELETVPKGRIVIIAMTDSPETTDMQWILKKS